MYSPRKKGRTPGTSTSRGVLGKGAAKVLPPTPSVQAVRDSLVVHTEHALAKRMEMFRYLAQYTLQSEGLLTLNFLSIKSRDLLSQLTQASAADVRHQAAQMARRLDMQGMMNVVAPGDMQTFADRAQRRAAARSTTWDRVVKAAKTTGHALQNFFRTGVGSVPGQYLYQNLNSLLTRGTVGIISKVAPVLVSASALGGLTSIFLIPLAIGGIMGIPPMNKLQNFLLGASPLDTVPMTVDQWVYIMMEQDALMQNLRNLGIQFDFARRRFVPLDIGELQSLRAQAPNPAALDYLTAQRTADAMTRLMAVLDDTKQPFVTVRRVQVQIKPGQGGGKIALGGRRGGRHSWGKAMLPGVASERPLAGVSVQAIEAML
jgi:hypothetical protein